MLFLRLLVYNNMIKEETSMRKLVTISREYGSGGRLIGRMVAEKMGIPFYDIEIIDMAVEKS